MFSLSIRKTTLCTAISLSMGATLAAAIGTANAGDNAGASTLAERSSATSSATNLGVLANAILDRWQPIAEESGAFTPAWRETILWQLNRMDARMLKRIAEIDVDLSVNANASYMQFAQALRNAQMQLYLNAQQSTKVHAKLGSTTTDQVFIPITPCRVVDTRNVGGPINFGTTRNFYFWSELTGYSWASQGGTPFPSSTGAGTTCPLTVNPNGGAPSAAMATVTVVNATAAGNFIIWGGANPIPTASALNWTA